MGPNVVTGHQCLFVHDSWCVRVGGDGFWRIPFLGQWHDLDTSIDSGANWTATNLTSAATVAFTASGANLFAGGITGVFKSTDNGASWTATNTGLTNTTVYSLVVSGTNLYTGTDVGVFRSTDNGAAWVAFNDSLAGNPIPALIVSGNQLLAGTYGQGIWRRTIP